MMAKSTVSSASASAAASVSMVSKSSGPKPSGTLSSSVSQGSMTAKSDNTGSTSTPLVLLTQDLTALLDNRTCIDLTIHITTTQLHTAQFHGHAAMLLDRGPNLIDGFLDQPLSHSLSLSPVDDGASATASHAQVSVHCNHSRLPDLLNTCRSLYADPQLAVQHLTHLLSTSQLSDCTLIVEDPLGSTRLTSARAHKFVLAARCPYFSTLFQSSFADTHSPTYSLPLDIFTSPQVFDNVLAFMYTGQLHTHPTSPLHVFDLFQCANYLGMAPLESHLEHVLRTMVHGLDSCTCTSCSAALPAVLLFADRMSLESLRTDAIKLFASCPLTLWTSLDFPTFPQPLQSAIIHQFTLAAEHDPASLLSSIVTLDTLIDRLSLRASKPTAKLVDTLTVLRDATLVPQLIPALPHLLNTGTLDRPPLMDIGRRFHVLATHLIPHRMDAGNGVMIAFTLSTTHAARKQRAASGDDAGIELNAQVTEALESLAGVALDWLAKRWINVPIVAPRGVYPASAAWQGFVEKVAEMTGVSVDEIVAAAAVGVGGSVVGGAGGSVMGITARQPRVRSMAVDGGVRPGVKVVGSATGSAKASATTSGKAVAGSKVDAGRTQAVPRPASVVVGGMVRGSPSVAGRRASSMAPGESQPQSQSRPLARSGPPMHSALRAERARSMIVTSSSPSSASSSSSSARPPSSLRPSSSLAANSEPARGRPGSAASATAVARKVTRPLIVVSSVPSNVSTKATTTRRAPSSSRFAASSQETSPPKPAIRRSVSMATLPSSRPKSASAPVSPLKSGTSPSMPSRLGRSPSSLPSSAAIPPVPPLPHTAPSSSSGLSERKYDPARLERLRRKSAESAARVALSGGSGGGLIAAVDLSTFRPSRIPAPSSVGVMGAGSGAGDGKRAKGDQ